MTNEPDSILDELRATLDVEASPEFHARVRMAIATVAPQRGWRPGTWTMSVGLAAVVVAVTVGMWPRPSARAEVQEQQTAVMPVTPLSDVVANQQPRSSTAMMNVPARAGRKTARSRMVAASNVPTREPEVLVPPGQAAALVRLIASIRDGETTLALAAWPEGPVVVAPVPEVEPIRIDPLPEPALVGPAEAGRIDS